MKLKCRPDDFCVEEINAFDIAGGPHAVYRLVKRSIGTPEAIDLICQRWKIHRDRISFGGMKDRHAHTTQLYTILHGPKRGLKQNNLEVTYEAQAPRSFAPADIQANRFTIIMRDMSEAAVTRARTAIEEAREHGLPNYFDDQRFGSVGESGKFVAQAWCLGDFERALWLAIAEANSHDRPEDRLRKKLLRDHWGNWPLLAMKITRSPIDPLIRFLADRPTDYRNAFARIRPEQRDFYLAAFQSHIWNLMLSRWIAQRLEAAQISEFEFDQARLNFHRSLPADQVEAFRGLQLPLPSARAKMEDAQIVALCESVLDGIGMKMSELKTKTPRDVYFSRGSRLGFVFPTQVNATDEEDDMHRGRRMMTLRFDLPRGCYATILIKRITTLAVE